jgi:hypothetical protein
MKRIKKELSLETLLKVRDTLNKKCVYIETHSHSVSPNGSSSKNNCGFDCGYNDGLNKSMGVVMDMIEKVAKFVSVCCGVKGISKSRMIGKIKGGGEHHLCYTLCSKCKKECEREWRLK